MSWQDRVNPFIALQSPTGQLFVALWRGNKRTKSKKLGLFEYAKAKGVLAQDLDVGGTDYPLTFYFEGENHDIVAQNFWNACDERGVWEVQHPTKGNLTLQLVTVVEDTQPLEAGNLTQFDADWIEVGIDNPAVSIAQLEDDVRDQIDNTQAAAADQFAAKVKINKPSLLARLKASVAKVLKRVEAFKDRIAKIQENISTVRAAVLEVTDGAVSGLASLTGAIQSLVVTPGLILRDARSRIDYYETTLSAAFADLTPKTASAGGVNIAAVQELVATACLCGMAQAIVEGSFSTREEALSYLERMHVAFLKVTNGLDGAQALYANSPIDRQYFSQTDSFNDLAELMRRVRGLLLRRSFDLAAAKRITLRRDRAPIEIALTEGVDFDVFIASNGLKGNEILLLPTGRQVVIYL